MHIEIGVADSFPTVMLVGKLEKSFVSLCGVSAMYMLRIIFCGLIS